MEKKKNIFIENPVFTIFAILGIVVILIAILAPVITGGADPTKGNLADAILPPSPEHLFGTDKMGRDIFT